MPEKEVVSQHNKLDSGQASALLRHLALLAAVKVGVDLCISLLHH